MACRCGNDSAADHREAFCAQHSAFCGVDAQGNFVRVRSTVIARVMGEHLL